MVLHSGVFNSGVRERLDERHLRHLWVFIPYHDFLFQNPGRAEYYTTPNHLFRTILSHE
jgi:hypothetical protein